MPEVDDAPVVGWVISRLEVVQHALRLCQHKVPFLPLEGLPKGHALPAAVLPHSLLQISSLQLSYKVLADVSASIGATAALCALC